ncbi:MAG: class I SAM-dependent methyltransferase [Bacteroidetes bacterium]|nr:class I SAM-dependent methyltransferase [Bacteroidota bacterium]MCL6098577.1 class I SAM-dependent methyltransferase [Bacteroidota bacterium]
MKSQNPWLKISAEDYEGHMSAPNVLQLQMLNKIFADVLNEFSPKSIAALGCTTGNGFEHSVGRNIEKVVGVDINPEYIAVCKKRYAEKLPQLKLICSDLAAINLPLSTFDLIHAALIFEYVDVDELLNKISKWLMPDGVLSVVLQLPSETSSPVSETQFQSLKLLSPLIKLIDPEEFKKTAQKYGLEEIKNDKIELASGKSFSVIKYVGKGLSPRFRESARLGKQTRYASEAGGETGSGQTVPYAKIFLQH